MARERSPALWLHTQTSITRKMLVCHRVLLLLWLLHFSSVYSDITDGNAEHLKREHSLIKPYQGEQLLVVVVVLVFQSCCGLLTTFNLMITKVFSVHYVVTSYFVTSCILQGASISLYRNTTQCKQNQSAPLFEQVRLVCIYSAGPTQSMQIVQILFN